MKEIENIEISKLKFDEDINQLVPEMTEEEFSDLVKSIDEEGQRTPIHINNDNTVLDGRHRVRALKELNINEVSAIKEDMQKAEALKFVRDTAVKRRNLSANQKLNIVLNAKDLIGDIQERARERQLSTLKQNKPFSSAEPNGEVKNDVRFSSSEPSLSKTDNNEKDKPAVAEQTKTNQNSTPVHENKEIADLAGVSTSTVMRAKKVKAEAPEVYEEVIKNNGGWDKAYRELDSVKKKKEDKQNEVAKVETPVKETEAPKAKKRDIREEINADAAAITPEQRNIMTSETNAINIVSMSDNLLHLLEDIQDLELTLQFLKSQNKSDLETVVKMSKAIEKIIEKGDLKNV